MFYTRSNGAKECNYLTRIAFNLMEVCICRSCPPTAYWTNARLQNLDCADHASPERFGVDICFSPGIIGVRVRPWKGGCHSTQSLVLLQDVLCALDGDNVLPVAPLMTLVRSRVCAGVRGVCVGDALRGCSAAACRWRTWRRRCCSRPTPRGLPSCCPHHLCIKALAMSVINTAVLCS